MADEKPMIDLLVEEYEAGIETVKFHGREIRVAPMNQTHLKVIMKMYPDNTAKQQAAAIVRHCKYPDGRPVFTKDDQEKLSNSTRLHRLGPILAIIYGAGVEEQVKNSEADDPETTSALH